MARSRFAALSFLPYSGLAILATCAKEKTAEPAAIPVVMITATEYAFQMPDTLSAGVTTFRLMNHGQELHHLVLIRLPEGQTMADFQKMNPAGPPPAGMTFKGGPNPAPPGGSAEGTLNLEAGRYVAVCFIPAADGQIHMRKGMMKELVVTPAASAAVTPTPDITVKLTDYGFELSQPLTAGRHVLRIENAGKQPHEFVFVKLEGGKTIQDFAQWAEKVQGPPPAIPMNGASFMGVGESNTVTVELTPGDYGFVCFVPDAADGKPHLAHGMIQQVKVM